MSRSLLFAIVALASGVALAALPGFARAGDEYAGNYGGGSDDSSGAPEAQADPEGDEAAAPALEDNGEDAAPAPDEDEDAAPADEPD